MSTLVGRIFRYYVNAHVDGHILCVCLCSVYMPECDEGLARARTVLKLRETHIIRDSWTKLNIAPAKIMQVNSSANKSIIFLSVRAISPLVTVLACISD